MVKVQNYSKEQIFDKNLLFFIPYYILRFEERLKEIDSEESELKKLVDDYKDIHARLLGLEAMDKIDYNYLHDLISLTSRLIEVVARDNENIKREVILMGGGKVLEMESEKIYNSGVAQGLSQGLSQGISQGIAESTLLILEDYGDVPDDLRKRICSELDIEMLKRWCKLASQVDSVGEFKDKM